MIFKSYGNTGTQQCYKNAKIHNNIFIESL